MEAGESIFALKALQKSPMRRSTTQGSYGGASVFRSTRSKIVAISLAV